ncbi:alpha/beta hydrolase [Phytohabitans sp. ZYX-F-186]|uniref:Alpha/beta hydrolase n=1 Tax=Phytohabitans maris TaxID=3071409 RepID=A0ABU0ZVQ7_9ACTN|nr:alpha/beta hydrolase [Phytohabitans sp. ZYX-F-186]MDQ7910592.1 alpha/beta hydrolase [Phytohabitans sp. ZYX-F-186]
MTIAHDVAGDGPTVVLLHSTVCDRRMWDPQVPALVDAGYRAVRADFRGFGETPVPDGPYSDARDVLDLLDLLGAERVAVVAASGGGRVGQEVAARWPGRVGALMLVSTALGGHEPGAELRAFGEREEALLAAGDVGGATELNVTTWLGPYAGEPARAEVREMQRHAFETQLAGDAGAEPIRVEFDASAITAPTLLVSGAHDLPDFTRIAATLAGRLPRARHIALDWAGHLPSLERPEAFNPLLLDFLHADFPPGRDA